MNNNELVALIREVSSIIETGTSHSISADVAPLRAVVQPNCHVGCGDKMDDSEGGFRMQLEWYAGQLLSMVDEKQWLGINSWINCTEKFTTRGGK